MTASDPPGIPGGAAAGPAAEAAESAGRPRRPRRPRPRRPRRILVVDDEDGMRLVLSRALARLGYQVFLAASGLEALDQLCTLDDLDAVVSDVTMPGMTGTELAQVILRDHPGLPILFVTASTVPDELLDHRMVGRLAKPPRLGELRERLELLIAGAPGGPPDAVGAGVLEQGATG